MIDSANYESERNAIAEVLTESFSEKVYRVKQFQYVMEDIVSIIDQEYPKYDKNRDFLIENLYRITEYFLGHQNHSIPYWEDISGCIEYFLAWK